MTNSPAVSIAGTLSVPPGPCTSPPSLNPRASIPIMVPPTVSPVAKPALSSLPPLPPRNRERPLAPLSFFAAKSLAMAAVSFIAPVIKSLLNLKINLPRPVPNTRYKDSNFFQCLPRNSIIF